MKLTWKFDFKSFIFNDLLALPVSNQDNETIKSLVELEKLSYLCLITQYGQTQQIDKPVSIKLKFAHFMVRVLNLTFILRLICFLTMTDKTMQTIVADPVINTPNREILIVLQLFIVIVMLVVREYILYLENNRKFLILRKLYHIRKNGFSSDYLNLTERQFMFFKRNLHFILINSLRFSKLTIVLLPFFGTGVRLNNPDSLATNSLIISACFWSITEGLTFIFLYSGGILTVTYIFILMLLYFCQLRSLVESTQNKIKCLTDQNNQLGVAITLKSLNYQSTSFLNQFDQLNSDFKYLWLNNVIVFSFLADSFIFFGAIVHINSDYLSDVLTYVGFFVLFMCAVGGYAGGVFHQKLMYLHIHYVRLLTFSSAHIQDSFKVRISVFTIN
ncbi:uncharacterized protein LOC107368754 [Tetranychus urticae]|uniref:uncharacterized protein LOC107368754 n=1 Tax=Tetranychus urticae TaxID=32264 RepID=UPI000D643F81|nr:uncharacterized protein LOC107368754 [Tetranychus urticae]